MAVAEQSMQVSAARGSAPAGSILSLGGRRHHGDGHCQHDLRARASPGSVANAGTIRRCEGKLSRRPCAGTPSADFLRDNTRRRTRRQRAALARQILLFLAAAGTGTPPMGWPNASTSPVKRAVTSARVWNPSVPRPDGGEAGGGNSGALLPRVPNSAGDYSVRRLNNLLTFFSMPVEINPVTGARKRLALSKMAICQPERSPALGRMPWTACRTVCR